jgi:hypothetical protein
MDLFAVVTQSSHSQLHGRRSGATDVPRLSVAR